MRVQAYLRQIAPGAAALILWSGLAFAQNTAGTPGDTPLYVGEMGTVVLGHGKPRAAATPRSDCGGGGLTGKIECKVTQNIEAAGSGSAPTVEGVPTSTVTFELSPVLELAGGTHRVRLNVKAQKPKFAPDIGRGTKRRLKIEARAIERELNEWRLDLNAEQAAALRQGGDLPFDVAGPFDGLRLWSLESREPLAVSLKDEPEAVLVFLREAEGRLLPIGDDSVAYGEAFVIELRFARAQEESQLTVDLEWEEGQRNVEVLRTGESRTLYRSDTLRLDYRNGAARLVEGSAQP